MDRDSPQPCEARDPRIDPLPGDVLRKKGRPGVPVMTYTVHSRAREKQTRFKDAKPGVFLVDNNGIFLPRSWKQYVKWAATAEVLAQGQGERLRPAAGK